MHKAKCPYCPWEGRGSHQFLGQAKSEMYGHFDLSEPCAIKFEADCQKETTSAPTPDRSRQPFGPA